MQFRIPLLLAVSIAFAAPALAGGSYTGTGTGPTLTSPSGLAAADLGDCHPADDSTGFTLVGDAGADFDVEFYDGSWGFLTGSFTVGDEAGNVPSSAAWACPVLWSSNGLSNPALELVFVGGVPPFPGSASYTYTDGL